MIHDRVLRLQPDVAIRRVEVDRRCSRDLERRIDAVWRRLQAERPGELYDDDVATLEHASPGEIHVGRAPFRYFAAQGADSDIRRELDLWCLGVGGVTTAADRLLFGRRAAVTHYRGHWELLPAGFLPIEGVAGDPVDAAGHLLRELHEEVAIESSRVVATTALALIPDASIRMSDLFFSVELDHSGPELAELIADPPCDEYDALVALARDEVHAFVREHGTRVLGTTLAMLRVLGHAI